MKKQFTNYFIDPYSKTSLRLISFKEQGNEIIDGIFINEINNTIYPIMNKVPVFLKNSIPSDFYTNYSAQFLNFSEEHIKSQIAQKSNKDFSFSHEWKQAYKDGLKNKIWGQSIEDRYNEFKTDLQITDVDLPNKLLLDVGCGNGLHVGTLAQKGAMVIGMDYSESVWNAVEMVTHENACFIQADLHFLPFKNESFDMVYSNGVLHHTSNTHNAFDIVEKMVKPSGKLYVWLYDKTISKKMNTFWRMADFGRYFINKMPPKLQHVVVMAAVYIVKTIKKIKGKPVNLQDLTLDMYDTFTPNYRFYHTFDEVKTWYEEAKYSNIKLTHSKNIFGIGVLGVKI